MTKIKFGTYQNIQFLGVVICKSTVSFRMSFGKITITQINYASVIIYLDVFNSCISKLKLIFYRVREDLTEVLGGSWCFPSIIDPFFTVLKLWPLKYFLLELFSVTPQISFRPNLPPTCLGPLNILPPPPETKSEGPDWFSQLSVQPLISAQLMIS